MVKKEISGRKWFGFVSAMVFITNLAIFLNLPVLRQIFGFFFLTLLLGILILQILKLNKIESIEKFVLSVGLSISFLMFFGLLLNDSSLALGYKTPLSTVPLLIWFNFAAIALILVVYRMNKNIVFSLPNFNLNASEKAFLIVPILFPALSIFGMHVMNTTDNNIILMFLLFLIPIYVTFVCFFNHKFPKRLYPVVIFSISISLLLIVRLRSNYIVGADIHEEYYYFWTTLDNLHWCVWGHSVLDACLSISLLPAIYQSILNVSPESLFRILHSLIYSISPLVIYIISKKYVGESYAFLASCFFMFQHVFFRTNYNARTDTAVLFFALAMMTLFSDKIDPLKKRILFIVFMGSCMISHYSTTYIFFFIVLGTFIGMEILSKKYTFKKVVSLTIVILFFSLIFFWYSQVTEVAFNTGVDYIGNTVSNLNKFFVEEMRSEGMQALVGKDIIGKGIPHKIEFIFTWLTFALTGIGIVTLIRRYKEMSFSELKFKKPDFLKDKFEVEYFIVALACAGLLVAMIALPFISTGYSVRLYPVAITILSIFFVIGGIILSKHFFFFVKRKPVLKEKNSCFFGKAFFSKEGFDGENSLQHPVSKSVEGKRASEVRAYIIILLVLIPYFFCVTGVTYQMFGYPRQIMLNSEGEQDCLFVHDQESYGAKWLGGYTAEPQTIYADFYGNRRLVSQGKIRPTLIDNCWFSNPGRIDNYIYLTHQNVVKGELVDRRSQVFNMTDYQDLFNEKNEIYDSGCSKIYR